MATRPNYYLLIATVLFFFNTVDAQTKEEKDKLRKPFTEIPDYRIGTELPGFGELKLLIAGQGAIETIDFKDKLLILDFWDTYCEPCIAALPHMEALQKQFGNKIQIIAVNPQPTEYVLKFWNNNKHTKSLKLASLAGDDAKGFSDYFLKSGVPHEAWIYKGKVIGITTAEYVDDHNINEVLSGKVPDWPVKNDFYQIDGQEQPLFKLDPKQIDTTSAVVKYAQISDYKTANGVSVYSIANSGIVRDAKHKTIRAYTINQEILLTYRINWMNALGYEKMSKLLVPGSNYASPNTVAWEVADKSKYIYEKKTGSYQGDWARRNAICFESVNPDSGQTDQQIYATMVRDLDRLLGLHVRWEKRKEKVLTLVRTTTINKFLARKDVMAERAVSVDAIPGIMSGYASNPYVFDETNYKGEEVLDINISDWTDISAIRKAIAPYDLALKEEERLVDKLVFSEVDGSLIVDGQMMSEAKIKKAAQASLPDPTPEEGKAFLEANKKRPGVICLPSGLQYKVIKKDTGVRPVLNDILSIRYTCSLVNGKIVDSSDEKGKPLRLRLQNEYGGDTKWLAGLREALKLMSVGSKYHLYIPSELAFQGQTTAFDGDTRLPANSAVIFEMELLRVEAGSESRIKDQ